MPNSKAFVMFRSSHDRLELELTGAEAKHKNALVTWSRLYDELRSRHGSVSGAMDHAKPYYEALHRCQAWKV